MGAEDVFDELEEFEGVDGFEEPAGEEAAVGGAGVVEVEGGHDDDAGLEVGVGELLEEIEAAAIGEIEIEKTELGAAGVGQFPALAGCLGLEGPITVIV